MVSNKTSIHAVPVRLLSYQRCAKSFSNYGPEDQPGDRCPANPPTYTARELDTKRILPVSCVVNISESPGEALLFPAGFGVIDEDNKGLRGRNGRGCGAPNDTIIYHGDGEEPIKDEPIFPF
jgi:hypothetical protein